MSKGQLESSFLRFDLTCPHQGSLQLQIAVGGHLCDLLGTCEKAVHVETFAERLKTPDGRIN